MLIIQASKSGEIAKNVFRDESITELLEETIRDYFLDLPVPTEKPPGKQTLDSTRGGGKQTHYSG